MTRNLVAFLLLRCAALVFGACALCGCETDVPAPHTRVVLRFDVKDDAKALDSACDVLRKRLKELEATEISVKRREGRDLAIDFRAPKGARLDKDSELIRALAQRGDMRFYIAASQADFIAAGKDMTAERQRVVEWLRKPENQDVSIERFNTLPEAQGGPPKDFCWYPHHNEEGKAKIPREDAVLPLVVPKEEWTFTVASLASVAKSQDRFGFPAVSFQMKPEKVVAFGDFTEAHINQPMTIVLNDEIVSYANIGERLPGQAQIYGRFTDVQVDNMVKVLRSGELPSKPALVSVEQVE